MFGFLLVGSKCSWASLECGARLARKNVPFLQPHPYPLPYRLQIADVVHSLLTSPAVRVDTNDIGIICAYWQQVRGVRSLLRARGLDNVRVGVVNDYQVLLSLCMLLVLLGLRSLFLGHDTGQFARAPLPQHCLNCLLLSLVCLWLPQGQQEKVIIISTVLSRNHGPGAIAAIEVCVCGDG